MSTEETLYQVGICPNCPEDAEQQLLFATDDSSGLIVELGEIVAYKLFETLSLFRCRRCGNALLYSTGSDFEGISVDELDRSDPSEVAKLTTAQFVELSTLLCSTNNESPKEKPFLDPSTPEPVKKCYEIGIRVRPFSNDLYALQLRKALEAVCKDLGASERLASGNRAMLWQQIDELRKQNAVGEFISNAALELKEISNSGAHYSELVVSDRDIRKLEHLLGLITTDVYGR